MHVPYLWISLYKFSLQATIYHHGSLCIQVIILPLATIAKTLYCNDSKITDFEMIDTKNSSTTHVAMYQVITSEPVG